ncbi:hypothetical protein HAX54_042028 [Datura stramonium]|uniref:Uncharacterized protein n=1 Tax=Datura stramonium TaxID=4076 RepID=A0ABS8SM07_DATST|nr:hypothetical protein [Datura stramonium]
MMAGLLQRSAVSFRRQGSSGLIWDDKYLSGQPVKHREEINEKLQGQGQPKEEMILTSSTTVGSTGRSRSNGGRVSLTVEPPSPKVSACGLCSRVINGRKGKYSRHRFQYGKRAL